MSSQDNENSTWKSVSKSKYKKYYPKEKSKEEDIVYPKTLKGFFEDGYCIYHFMSKCDNETKCNSKHMPSDHMIFRMLRKILLDPFEIPNIKNTRTEIIDYIKENTSVKEYNMNPYLTSCWYAIRNVTCNNVKHKRFIKYDITYNDKIVPIYICFPVAKSCKTRVTCGFHFDVEYEYKDQQFSIKNIISLIDEYQNDTQNENKIFFSNDNNINSLSSPEVVKNEKKETLDDKLRFNLDEKITAEVNVSSQPSEKLTYKNRHFNFDDLENKTNEELKYLVMELVKDNNTLSNRNIELNYQNKVTSISKILSSYTYHNQRKQINDKKFHNNYYQHYDTEISYKSRNNRHNTEYNSGRNSDSDSENNDNINYDYDYDYYYDNYIE